MQNISPKFQALNFLGGCDASYIKIPPPTARQNAPKTLWECCLSASGPSPMRLAASLIPLKCSTKGTREGNWEPRYSTRLVPPLPPSSTIQSCTRHRRQVQVAFGQFVLSHASFHSCTRLKASAAKALHNAQYAHWQPLHPSSICCPC